MSFNAVIQRTGQPALSIPPRELPGERLGSKRDANCDMKYSFENKLKTESWWIS